MANHSNPNPDLVTWARLEIDTVPGHDVTGDMLEEAATLFRENYAVWGDIPKEQA